MPLSFQYSLSKSDHGSSEPKNTRSPPTPVLLDLGQQPARAEPDRPRGVGVDLVAVAHPLQELRHELDVARHAAAEVHEVDLAALAVLLDQRDEVVDVRVAARAGVEVEHQVVLLARRRSTRRRARASPRPTCPGRGCRRAGTSSSAPPRATPPPASAPCASSRRCAAGTRPRSPPGCGRWSSPRPSPRR